VDEKLLEALCCPVCHSGLKLAKNSLLCSNCEQSYELLETGQAIMLSAQERERLSQSQEQAKSSSSLHQFYLRHQNSLIANFARRLVRLLLPPIFVYLKRPARILNQLFPSGEKRLVIDIGAGNNPIHPEAITVDVCPESGAKIIASAEHLPFKDNSLDGVVSCGLLEHLKKPWLTSQEMVRVLKPGGYVFMEMPLLQGIHYNPFDEQRFTPDGLETLFSGLTTIEKGIDSGPGTVLAHILPIWLALVFSFGSKTLFELLFLLFAWLTFPIKYSDWLLLKFPMSSRAPFAVYYLGRKNQG